MLIYRFNINTKKEYLITKGKYDVTKSLAVDEKSKLLYFIASPNNATQRYLYKVRLDGKGKLEMVTHNELEGSHNYKISPKANFAFHKFSNYYKTPMSQLIRLTSHHSINKGERISAKFIPAFETRIHTSPGPGEGVGSSCISKLSGPPCFVTITAFISPHHSSNLSQDV